MKLSTHFLVICSFLISSYLASAENKGLLNWAVVNVSKATSSAVKGVMPLSYALDSKNAQFYSTTVQKIQDITIEEFKKNIKLQDDLRSLSSRSDRANHCIIDALVTGNTKQLIDLCKVNKSNIHPEIFKLVSRFFEEQKEDITTILGISSEPVEDPTPLINPSYIELIEKTRQFSLKMLTAIKTNNIDDLKDILETRQTYLPQWLISAATCHLKQVHATIATVIAPQQAIKHVYPATAEPAHLNTTPTIVTASNEADDTADPLSDQVAPKANSAKKLTKPNDAK